MGLPRWSWSLALVAACAGAPARDPGETEVRSAPDAGVVSTAGAVDAGPSALPLFRLPADVRATAERVSLEIVPDREGFSGQVEIDLVLDHARDDLFVSSRELTLLRGTISVAGRDVPVHADMDDAQGVARLTAGTKIPAGDATLRLDFQSSYNGRLVGNYRLKTSGGWAVFTQFEPTDARRAFPCLDEPAFKIPWTVELTVPEHLLAFSNAPLEREEFLGNGLKRVRFQATRPLPSYLVAYAVGDFDVLATPPLPPDEIRSRSLQIRGIAAKGRGAELAYAVGVSRELIPLLERWFGFPYPYEKLDLVSEPDFVFGGMENAGLITFTEAGLLVREGHATERNRLGVAWLLAHEISHSWFGDWVTMRFWDDLWLNESFATFVAPEILRIWKPPLGVEMSVLEDTSAAMKNDELEGSTPMHRPIRTEGDITGFDTDVIYPKGAAVLGMFQGLLGPEQFRAAVARYLQAHADANASMEDLLTELSRERDIRAAAASFIDQPGVPLVRGALECAHQGAGVTLHQERARPRGSTAPDLRWVVPVCVRAQGLRGPRCTLLEHEEGRLDLGTARCPRWIHLNAGGQGYYRWLLRAPDLDALMKGWRSLQSTERVSAADALLSAGRDGAIPAAEVLARLSPLSRDVEPSVSNLALDFLVKARLDWTEPGQDWAFRALMQRELRPVLGRLGWSPRKGEPVRQAILRSDVVSVLALQAAEPEVLARAAALGRRWIELGGRDEHGGAPLSLRDVSIRAAARTGDASTFDALEAILRGSDDARVRLSAAGGLAAFVDPLLAQRARELVIASGLRSLERWMVIERHVKTPELREAMRVWLVAHQKELPAVLPENKLAWLPELLVGCSEQASEQLAGSFGPLAQATPGLEYSLRKAQELTRLCRAVREVQAPSVASYLARQRPRVEQPAAPR